MKKGGEEAVKFAHVEAVRYQEAQTWATENCMKLLTGVLRTNIEVVPARPINLGLHYEYCDSAGKRSEYTLVVGHINKLHYTASKRIPGTVRTDDTRHHIYASVSFEWGAPTLLYIGCPPVGNACCRTTACRSPQHTVGKCFMAMLTRVVESIRRTSAAPDQERVNIQIIVTPQGQFQVFPVHKDTSHIVSTMLVGEKVWQVSTAGSARDPCTDDTGTWVSDPSETQPEFVSACRSGHRVVSEDHCTQRSALT